jgi:Fe-S cluster assembly protein SufD
MSQKRQDFSYLSDLAYRSSAKPWIKSLRRQSLSQFQKMGLPSRKHEDWKYTVIDQKVDLTLPFPESSSQTHQEKALSEDSICLHFTNGFYNPLKSLKLPKGLTISPFEELQMPDLGLGQIFSHETHAFASLNAAFFENALQITLDSGLHLEKPIELIYEGDCLDKARQWHGRLIIRLKEDSSLTLIERHHGQGNYFTTQVTEIFLDKKAHLRHIKIQDESRLATHLAFLGISQDESSYFTSTCLQIGARLGRQEVKAHLKGDDAQIILSGPTLVGQDQVLDNNTLIIHDALRGSSQQVFRTVLEDNGHGIYLGTVKVAKGAQKTDAQQMSRALMLSDKSDMDCKPALEIFADDVKCSHGATIGDLDNDSLFYLKARGIDEKTARYLLTLAFLKEALAQIGDEKLEEKLADVIDERVNREEQR